jgi:hypothetical protein
MPNEGEKQAVTTITTQLKAVVDELIHYCDGARDTIEAYLKGDTVKLPRAQEGREMVRSISRHIASVKNEYAYRSRGRVADEADIMFGVAQTAIDQLNRVSSVLEQLTHGQKVSPDELAQLRLDQIQHRMGDMMRIYQVYANKPTLTAREIAAVSNIDLTMPLEPQLGFDPDSV